MREILFRAKTLSEDEYIDCGEWIEGFYTCFNDEEHRIYTGYSETDCGEHYPDWISVDPETVRQYTGLIDKNGNMIFEGDIVKTHSGLLGKIVFGTFFDYEFECDIQGYFWIGKDDEGCAYNLALSEFWGGHEVVGNIYDNPELMNI